MGWDARQDDNFWCSLNLFRNVGVKYLPREELHGADTLAKDGSNKAKMISSWT